MSRVTKRISLLEAIGSAVAKRRSELGLSQEELAERAEVHRTYISDVERGTRNLSVLTLDRIANALELPVGVLLLLNSTELATARKRK